MLTFNLALGSFGIDPGDTRLLRHERRANGRTAYALWRDDRPSFEAWQAIQLKHNRSYFGGHHWASFVVTPDGMTLFVGIYDVGTPRTPAPDSMDPFEGGLLDPELVEIYPTTLSDAGQDYVGRLAIEWGSGTRSWRQIAARQDKPILELRRTSIDPPFPGFTAFTTQLSEITSLPPAWSTALGAAQGVYLLTCPRTHEQYVGSATGTGGFLGRWLNYVENWHGGNIGLRSREPADYRVSILQVAETADDRDAVLSMESLWKAKLQSREMGLNRN